MDRLRSIVSSQLDCQQKMGAVWVVAVAVGALLLGVTATYLASYSAISMMSRLTRDSYKLDQRVTDILLEEIDTEELNGFLKIVAEYPHATGQKRDLTIANWIRDNFLQFGLDHVDEHSYESLLSYPDTASINGVQLLGQGDDNILFTAASNATPSTTLDSGPLSPYNAYSANGSVETSSLVYANYGRLQDFRELKNAEIDLEDSIVIIREGEIFLGKKVANAEAFGCLGVILYSDPQQVAHDGKTHVAPKDLWLPGEGVPMGTVMNGVGDPVTPGWPAIKGALRLNSSKVSTLPKIPVYSVSYNSARELFKTLGGGDSPTGWAGSLSEIDYKMGGEFTDESNVKKVRLDVSNHLTSVSVSNVVGVIRGEVEPDRYVIVGTHRDAWTTGAIDPSTATAALVKVAHAFSATMESTGWRPRRSLVFVSWGANEFGMVGSNEWLEEHLPRISQRAVAYINSDYCVAGPDLSAQASQSLKQVLVEALKGVKDPRDKDRSYYDYWRETAGEGSGGAFRLIQNYLHNNDNPTIDDVSARSDHGPFAFRAGVPVMDVAFADMRKYVNATTYAVRHSRFDTYELYKNVVDPDLSYLQLCTRVLASSARHVAEAPVLPHNFPAMAEALVLAVEAMASRVRTNGAFTQSQHPTLKYLEGAVEEFVKEASAWVERANKTNLKDPLAVRMLNDQIMQVDRVFVLPHLPFQNGTQHAIFSASRSDVYGRVTFPGIADILQGHEDWRDEEEEREKRYAMMSRHLSDLMITIRQAAKHLRDFHAL